MRYNLHRVQSSPGYLQVGHVPSNWTRHIPQTSSSGMSHRQEATAFHSLMVTFMTRPSDAGYKGQKGREEIPLAAVATSKDNPLMITSQGYVVYCFGILHAPVFCFRHRRAGPYLIADKKLPLLAHFDLNRPNSPPRPSAASPPAIHVDGAGLSFVFFFFVPLSSISTLFEHERND